jgi:hypothetical protein
MLSLAGGHVQAGGPAPVLIRVANFTVPPHTGPIGHIILKNTADAPYEATVELTLPDGWKGVLGKPRLVLESQETVRIPFTIERAVDVESNLYPVTVKVTGADGAVASRTREVACASAPYFKPKIDGNTDDWDDAIAVTFSHKGRDTVISTAWNRTHFAVCVEVDEEKLVGYTADAALGTVDAVQFALAPSGSETGRTAEDPAGRYEFLVVDSPGLFAKGRCFFLMKPGMSLGASQEARPLEALEFADAQVVVKRKGARTVYECAVPWSAMPGIRPDTGREICFSVMVHDPDGTGLRDWGAAAGLWPSQRNRRAWSLWPGAKWPEGPPYDNKIEWGLCSSKY